METRIVPVVSSRCKPRGCGRGSMGTDECICPLFVTGEPMGVNVMNLPLFAGLSAARCEAARLQWSVIHAELCRYAVSGRYDATPGPSSWLCPWPLLTLTLLSDTSVSSFITRGEQYYFSLRPLVAATSCPHCHACAPEVAALRNNRFHFLSR